MSNVTSFDMEAMNLALDEARASIDPVVQNGAVIYDHGFMVDDRPVPYVLGRGHNRFPYGVMDYPARWERPAKCLYVEHAERAAIYAAASTAKEPARGASIACPWASCADCARAIVMSGIGRLVRFPMSGDMAGWSDSTAAGDTILREAGVEIVELDLADFDIPEGLRLGQYRDATAAAFESARPEITRSIVDALFTPNPLFGRLVDGES